MITLTTTVPGPLPRPRAGRPAGPAVRAKTEPPPDPGPPRRAVRDGGFTLVELLVVLVILGLLAALTTPRLMAFLGGAKADAARLQIQSLATTVDLYRLDVGQYPPAGAGLNALIVRPGNVPRWNGPYIKKADMLIDPWGRPYRYRAPGQHGDVDIYTLGADDSEGGEGENQDSGSW